MSLRLGDIAPNFTAATTAGEIDFYGHQPNLLENEWLLERIDNFGISSTALTGRPPTQRS
jgi:hypothetical protein